MHLRVCLSKANDYTAGCSGGTGDPILHTIEVMHDTAGYRYLPKPTLNPLPSHHPLNPLPSHHHPKCPSMLPSTPPPPIMTPYPHAKPYLTPPKPALNPAPVTTS